MSINVVDIAIAKGYTNNELIDALKQLGVLKGTPCTIKSYTNTQDGVIITYSWTDKEFNEHTEDVEYPLKFTISPTNHHWFINGVDSGQISLPDLSNEPGNLLSYDSSGNILCKLDDIEVKDDGTDDIDFSVF